MPITLADDLESNLQLLANMPVVDQKACCSALFFCKAKGVPGNMIFRRVKTLINFDFRDQNIARM